MRLNSIVLLLASCLICSAQNITNFVAGQRLAAGSIISTVPSGGFASFTLYTGAPTLNAGLLAGVLGGTSYWGCLFTNGATSSVTNLAWYCADAAVGTHDCVIVDWTTSNTVASGTTPISSAGSNTWATVAITPITLVAGRTYFKGAKTGTDQWWDESTQANFGANYTLGISCSAPSSLASFSTSIANRDFGNMGFNQTPP